MSTLKDAISAARLGGMVPIAMTPTPAMMQALDTTTRIGAKDPRLFGGAVRDLALGLEPRDYDILCDLWDIADRPAFLRQMCARTARNFLCGEFHRADDEIALGVVKQSIEARLREKGIRQYSCEKASLQDGRYSIRYRIEDGGLPIDLCLGAEKGRSLETPADAPINSGVVTKEGTCFADPQFEDHIARKLHQPYPGRFDNERYESLKSRVPDLKHEPSAIRSYVL